MEVCRIGEDEEKRWSPWVDLRDDDSGLERICPRPKKKFPLRVGRNGREGGEAEA